MFIDAFVKNNKIILFLLAKCTNALRRVFLKKIMLELQIV